MARVGYPFPHGVTVYVQKPTVVIDPYSGEEERLDWSNLTETAYAGCGLVPRQAVNDEPLVSGRAPVYIGVYIVGPLEMDVTPRDRVRIADEVFEVDGDPVRWVSPLTGTALGTQVNLLRMEG